MSLPYIMHLNPFIDYSLSLSLPAWFQVVEIEVRFMTIRTPSLHQNYWPWRNTFHNFDWASITILVASNNFLVIKARYILFTLWPMNLCSTLILKKPLPWGHKFYTYMAEASNSINILIMYSICLVDAEL